MLNTRRFVPYGGGIVNAEYVTVPDVTPGVTPEANWLPAELAETTLSIEVG